VLASGVLIIASGPALCSPLKSVGFAASKPQAVAPFGSCHGLDLLLLGAEPGERAAPW